MVFSGSMGNTPSEFAPSWPVATRRGQALGQHAKVSGGPLFILRLMDSDRPIPAGGDHEFEQFRAQVGRSNSQACEISARPRETRGITIADRIGRNRRDDGNRGSGLLQRAIRLRTRGNDGVDFQAHEFRYEAGQAISFAVAIAFCKGEIGTADVAQLAHALHERVITAGIDRGLARRK